MEDLTKKYYDNFNINEWNRLDSPAGQIEYTVFFHFIKQYLKSRSVILDIGGGPGRYAINLAKLGHKLALGDLSTELIAIAKLKIHEAGVQNSFISINEMNITDLNRFEENTFDAVISLGPFYHLTNLTDRNKAVAEIKRILKPKGIAFVSAYTIYTWINGLIDRAIGVPNQVPEGMISKVFQNQIYINPTEQGFTNGYFMYLNEFESLFESHKFNIVDIVSSKSIAFGKENEMAKLKEERRDVYDEVMQLVIRTANDRNNISNSGQIMLIVESEKKK